MQVDLTSIRTLHQAGQLEQAKEGYLALLANEPDTLDYIAACNNIGTICYTQGKIDEAILYYQKAIAKQSNYIDAYYNLGLALLKKNLIPEAINTYQKLLLIDTTHFAARFHLACAFMQQNKIENAIAEFLTITVEQPYHFETQSNLATCYLKQGDFDNAKLHYRKALELQPDDTQILFNLGYITMQEGHLDTAIQYYQRAVQIDPDSFSAQNNLGVAFLAKQRPEFAMPHFQEALRLQPQNESIHYIVTMLSQNKKLLSAPPDYIQSLFDAYADHYEPHLRIALEYKIPELFEHALSKIISPHQLLHILDLGCGTGLCGIPFKKYAKTLTGVDLSLKMLEIAAQKNLYDALIVSDINAFLSDKTAQYDLILAGDVLVYSGDLNSLFESISRALSPEGLVIFNTEIEDSSTFKLNQSGRFSHHKSYIDALAEQYSLSILFYQQIITRMQNNEPVYGHLYILRKHSWGS
ncbi:MAG: yrrB [Gammaproteobacteria bacterium]|jgi:predicted TPR repeat methyltransferase|nr:yrrB [Gammaproteobacteria bacterium]